MYFSKIIDKWQRVSLLHFLDWVWHEEHQGLSHDEHRGLSMAYTYLAAAQTTQLFREIHQGEEAATWWNGQTNHARWLPAWTAPAHRWVSDKVSRQPFVSRLFLCKDGQWCNKHHEHLGENESAPPQAVLVSSDRWPLLMSLGQAVSCTTEC